MSTAILAAPGAGAALGIDRLFLVLALAATAILIALVLLDGQPLSAALILGGFGPLASSSSKPSSVTPHPGGGF